MQTLCVIAFMLATFVLAASTASGAWDPGGNTPPNADAINRAAGVSQPIEPRADTSREGQIKGSIGAQ